MDNKWLLSEDRLLELLPPFSKKDNIKATINLHLQVANTAIKEAEPLIRADEREKLAKTNRASFNPRTRRGCDVGCSSLGRGSDKIYNRKLLTITVVCCILFR